MKSLLNLTPSQISLQDLHNDHHHDNQSSPLHHHHHLLQTSHFDPTSSQDDFLDQMLSIIPSSSWSDLKSPWDLNPSNHTIPNSSNAINGSSKHRDLSDETAPPSDLDNMGFQFDESPSLASKLRIHQMLGGNSAAAKAAMMLQQQLLMSRGVPGAGIGDSGLPPMPLTLGGRDIDRSPTDDVDGSSSFKTPNLAQNFGASGTVMNQPSANGSASSAGGTPAQPKQKVRARRGHATDPHSIAERLRRERIAERMKALQELVPNANKTDKASMLDEIIDYVKFLQLQVKVLSMSRLGGAAGVAPRVADMSSEGVGDCIQANGNTGPLGRGSNGNGAPSSNDSMTVAEHQVAKLMEKDMGSAMQYLQGKGLCLMPISLATAISTATCHSRNPMINNQGGGGNHAVIASNGEGPSSPSMSVLSVQSTTMGNGTSDGPVKDSTSVSKP